jgi:DNA-binding transcriptional regulator of glucitol operon
MTDNFKPLIILFFIVIAVQIAMGYMVYSSFNTMSDRGTFGDMFGVANTFFSGLAFAGIVYAILLQRKELREK